MKSATLAVASAIIVALTAACAGNSSLSGNSKRVFSVYPVLAGERLQGLAGSTGLDALRAVPGYSRRANRPTPPRFVLILDGMRASDLEPLRTLRASDILEIRIVGETETPTGDVEVVVTTFAGRTRVR